MPIVRLALTIKELSSGDLLLVEATDPAFEADVHAWCEMTGHVLESFQAGDVLEAGIRVA